MGRYLFVGLGNPGDRYANSRHNAGWLVVDELVARWNEGLNPQWQNEKKTPGSNVSSTPRLA